MRLRDVPNWASTERYLIDRALQTVDASEQALAKIKRIETRLRGELNGEVQAGRSSLGSRPEDMYTSYFKTSIEWQDANGGLGALERRATMYAAAATAVRGYRDLMSRGSQEEAATPYPPEG